MRILSISVFIFLLASCNTTKKTATVKEKESTSLAPLSKELQTDTSIKDKGPDLAKNFETLQGKWQIVSIQPGIKEDPLTVNNGFIEFRKDNTVSGSGGCNSFSGNYKLMNTNIFFRNLVSTKMSCDKMEMEYMLMKYLSGNINSILFKSDNEIYLKDAGPNGIILCRRM